MLAGVLQGPGQRVGPALVIAPDGVARPGEPGHPDWTDKTPGGIRVLAGDHPVPGPRSVAAGRALLDFIERVPEGGSLLCLWSGGSSALVEALPASVSTEALARANRWLLGSGLPIDAVNRIRTALSCLKGGRLATRLPGRRVTVLAISDVPGDDPAAIGSGPWTPAPSAMSVAGLPAGVPSWLQALTAHAPPAPAPGDSGLARVDFRIVASGPLALAAAAGPARAAGLPVTVHQAPLAGEVAAAAARVLECLDAGPPGWHGWSGETTVQLPASPGQGGRNSHLALALAVVLAGRDDIVVLCGATDGLDGAGPGAGGWADGGVTARGRALGLDAHAALAGADAGRYLAQTGDALHIGPTGTNVMDLVLALRRR